jgi:hypothetical protein
MMNCRNALKFTGILVLALAPLWIYPREKASNIANAIPEFTLINRFSNKIAKSSKLVLYGYGINHYLPKEYVLQKKVANFDISYSMTRTRETPVELKEARGTLVALCESILKEINSDSEIIPRLDDYPATSANISLAIYIVDENDVGLGSGISDVFFTRGEVRYREYKISDYGGRGNTMGKHSYILEETYEEALDIATKDGSLASQTNLFKTII